MDKIWIKPLSVNAAYRGRRFSTQALKDYKEMLAYLVPYKKIGKPPYKVYYEFGISGASDLDNHIKAFQDFLADRYGFNDNLIYEIHAVKKKVKKGAEYITFELSPF